MDMYDRINEIIKSRKINKRKLCLDLNISYSTLDSMFARHSSIEPVTIINNIANYLDVDVEYLVIGKSSRALSMQEYEILHLMKNLSSSDKDKILAFVQGISSK